MARPLLIASDHAGFELKRKLTDALKRKGIAFEDLGPDTADSVDYFAGGRHERRVKKIDGRG